tara:strand:- start:1133 stop:1282 length:150 start_codon:yes stop_codon:yes gene_type:complete
MPSSDPKIKKALKDKVITKKQYDKLPDALLLGIIKSKTKTKGGKVVKKP